MEKNAQGNLECF